MLGYFEKFLFVNFKNMPAWVRVLTYLVFLLLFVYLMLVPRFINGQLVVRDSASGGFIPYRGAELQMAVEGHDYKFKANEGGYWSIPVVSKLPTNLELQVFHSDLGQWFPVTFSAARIWQGGAQRIEIANATPYVKVAVDSDSDRMIDRMLAMAGELIGFPIPAANAVLIIPSEAPARPAPAAAAAAPVAAPAEAPKVAPVAAPAKAPAAAPAKAPAKASARAPAAAPGIQEEVISMVADVLGKPPAQIGAAYRLTGDGAPTYVQKIRIVNLVEKKYEFSIPDEHWTTMATVGELADYVQKRQWLYRTEPEIDKNRKASWPAIQQSIPADRRPIFKPGLN